MIKIKVKVINQIIESGLIFNDQKLKLEVKNNFL